MIKPPFIVHKWGLLDCRLRLLLPSIGILCPIRPNLVILGQQNRQNAKQRQISAHFHNEGDARRVGDPAENGGTESAQAEGEAKKQSGHKTDFTRQQLLRVDDDDREGRRQNKPGAYAHRRGPKQIRIWQRDGERRRTEDRQPYNVASAEPVCQRAAEKRPCRGCRKKRKQKHLGAFHRQSVIVNQIKGIKACNARNIDVFGKNEKDENDDGGDDFVRRQAFYDAGRLARFLWFARLNRQTGVPARNIVLDNDAGDRRKREPDDAELAERHEDKRRHDRPHRASYIAAHLEDRLRESALASRRQVCDSRRLGMKYGRSDPHGGHGQ